MKTTACQQPAGGAFSTTHTLTDNDADLLMADDAQQACRSSRLDEIRAGTAPSGNVSGASVRGVEQSSGDVWSLYRADERVADLIVTNSDFPWLQAQIRAQAAFEGVRPLFTEELRLLDRVDQDVDAWEAAYAAIRAALTLRYPHGGEIPEFLLHIDGDAAWWRWSDEPFDEE